MWRDKLFWSLTIGSLILMVVGLITERDIFFIGQLIFLLAWIYLVLKTIENFFGQISGIKRDIKEIKKELKKLQRG